VLAQLVVAAALVALEPAADQLLGLRRQLGQHLLFRAAEQERPQQAAERTRLTDRIVGARDRL
jgi:hypothetical protein